ncbi:beta-lactamase/transpeptidase-like protein [Ramaria rubella]|nr:beta-lactamase/transpeptidase-like protein [Ramaria rubella]
MFLLFTILFILAFPSLETAVLCAGDRVPLHTRNLKHGDILDNDFASWLEKTGANWGMKGVAVAVVRKNEDTGRWITETRGFGVANRWGDAVDEETLFSIGSNSKLFTALSMGLLVANESILVDWDTKIKDIVPESVWNLQDPIARDQANLVDILSHRTGLPRHDLSYSYSDTPETATVKLRFLRPSAEFRETYQYNNQMFILADHIISNLSGITFGTFVTRNILSPAGMTSTTYKVTEAVQSGRFADGFLITGKDKEGKLSFKPIPFWDEKTQTLDAAAGGVISNAKDMATWLQVLLQSGISPFTNATVIPPEVIDKVAQGVSVLMSYSPAPELSPTIYGMGQARYTYQGRELIEHDGGTIGHFSFVIRAPHDNVGIAVLTNAQTSGPFLQMTKFKLLEKSLGLKTVDWEGRYSKTSDLDDDIEPQPRRSDGVPPTLPLDYLAGTYFNPAYGSVTLCPYPPSSSNQPPRKECEGIAFEALPPLLNASVPVLLATWPKIWSDHLILHHTSRDHFVVTSVLTFPAPFPEANEADEDSRPFAIASRGGSVEFVYTNDVAGEWHVEGVACKGIWGAGWDVAGLKGEGRDGAEVWFDRVM